jgi:hypothetical protein
MKILAIALLFVSVGLCGQYTREHGDSIYSAYLRDMPKEQQIQEPYYVTCIIRYDDIAYQRFTVKVRWHYFVVELNKYRIIPVDGRVFLCDNVEENGK